MSSEEPNLESYAQPKIEGEKGAQIQQLIERDQQVFAKWVIQQPRPTLDVPFDALKFMLVSPKIYELISDPKRVAIKRYEATDNLLDADVIYKNSLIKSFMRGIGGKPQSSNVLRVSLVTNHTDGGDILNVKEMKVADSLRQQGIGTAFNERLREAAKKMGFWVITGQNEQEQEKGSNLTFFTEKLGRVTLAQVKPELRQLFASQYKKMNSDMVKSFTIDFLDPQDRQKYLRS